jgi:hypothetical protein
MVILLFGLQNGSNIGTSYDYKKCIGLKVKPRQGDGLLFYSVFPNGTIDRVILLLLKLHSMHVCFPACSPKHEDSSFQKLIRRTHNTHFWIS